VSSSGEQEGRTAVDPNLWQPLGLNPAAMTLVGGKRDIDESRRSTRIRLRPVAESGSEMPTVPC
jgi:hypothetical protein